MDEDIRYIVTFATTNDAYGFKKHCEDNNIAGRLIPIPAKMHAGCGMVWSAPLTARVPLTQALERDDVHHSELTLLSLPKDNADE